VSISFGNRESVPLDGNVLRVGSRLWGIPDPQNSSGDRIKIGKKFDRELGLLNQA
jgi:adenine-specific DNA glycosylase